MTPPKVNEEYKENIRKSIIERAIFEFSSKGFFKTRMDDIVTKRFSKGTIYNYFNSKTELYLAVQEELRKVWRQATQFSIDKNTIAADSLTHYIKLMVKSIGEMPIEDKKANFETIGIALNHEDKRIFESIKQDEKNYLNISQEIIKRGKESGAFKNNLDEEFLSSMIISFIQGMQLMSILMEKEYNWEIMGELVAKWVLNEVKK